MIKNCKECGKTFFYTGRVSRCPACIEKEEKEFDKVIKYIKKNPNEDIKTVSQETGVREGRIMKWVRDGRIIITKGVKYECQRCGTQISKGRFCEKCAKIVEKEVAENIVNTKKPFFLSKDQ